MSSSSSSSSPSPFASPSFEPRFAFDSADTGGLAHALQLHVLCNNVSGWAYREGDAVFIGFRDGNARLAVAAQLHGFPGSCRWEPLFTGLDLTRAVEAIARWLADEAEYPEPPWFDGGEARGFSAYHVPYRGQALGPYGFMVVAPKWFEIHK